MHTNPLQIQNIKKNEKKQIAPIKYRCAYRFFIFCNSPCKIKYTDLERMMIRKNGARNKYQIKKINKKINRKNEWLADSRREKLLKGKIHSIGNKQNQQWKRIY
jgi:hypothetical protein